MSWPEVAIYGFGALTALAALAVVTARNVVHAALFLVITLGGVGVLFLLLGAEFIGWAQFLVYVGAIIVLLLFGLMLTRAPIGRDATDNQQRLVAVGAAAATFAVLTWLIWRAFGDEEIALETPTRTADVGTSLFTNFILPFELVSVLLLAALIGAIVLARRDEGRQK